jgi:hypothetical protein
LLIELEKSHLGCFLKGRCLNSFLYADDLILISTSVSDLDALINLSSSILKSIDLHINFSKSCCMRIGKRFKNPCNPIFVGLNPIAWVNQAKYLGVSIISHCAFKCNWQDTRKQFFSSLNHILFSLGSKPNIAVTLSLFHSICFPVLSYGIAAVSLSSSELSSFAFAYNNVFYKLFHSSDKSVIEQCQFFSGFFPFQIKYDLLRLTFLTSLSHSENVYSDPLFSADCGEITAISSKYNLKEINCSSVVKSAMWSHFEQSLFAVA